MLIYEKNNKLNINFDNEISENPDLQIGKNGDKTEVLVDGSSNPTIPVPVLPEDVGKAIVVNEDGSYVLANAGGGGSESFVIVFSGRTANNNAACDKTWSEIEAACMAHANIVVYYKYVDHGTEHRDQLYFRMRCDGFYRLMSFSAYRINASDGSLATDLTVVMFSDDDINISY